MKLWRESLKSKLIFSFLLFSENATECFILIVQFGKIWVFNHTQMFGCHQSCPHYLAKHHTAHDTPKLLCSFISTITLFGILKYNMTFESLTSGSCSLTNFCIASNMKFSLIQILWRLKLFWYNSCWWAWWSSGFDFSNFWIVRELCVEP